MLSRRICKKCKKRTTRYYRGHRTCIDCILKQRWEDRQVDRVCQRCKKRGEFSPHNQYCDECVKDRIYADPDARNSRLRQINNAYDLIHRVENFGITPIDFIHENYPNLKDSDWHIVFKRNAKWCKKFFGITILWSGMRDECKLQKPYPSSWRTTDVSKYTTRGWRYKSM